MSVEVNGVIVCIWQCSWVT